MPNSFLSMLTAILLGSTPAQAADRPIPAENIKGCPWIADWQSEQPTEIKGRNRLHLGEHAFKIGGKAQMDTFKQRLSDCSTGWAFTNRRDAWHWFDLARPLSKLSDQKPEIIEARADALFKKQRELAEREVNQVRTNMKACREAKDDLIADTFLAIRLKKCITTVRQFKAIRNPPYGTATPGPDDADRHPWLAEEEPAINELIDATILPLVGEHVWRLKKAKNLCLLNPVDKRPPFLSRTAEDTQKLMTSGIVCENWLAAAPDDTLADLNLTSNAGIKPWALEHEWMPTAERAFPTQSEFAEMQIAYERILNRVNFERREASCYKVLNRTVQKNPSAKRIKSLVSEYIRDQEKECAFTPTELQAAQTGEMDTILAQIKSSPFMARLLAAEKKQNEAVIAQSRARILAKGTSQQFTACTAAKMVFSMGNPGASAKRNYGMSHNQVKTACASVWKQSAVDSVRARTRASNCTCICKTNSRIQVSEARLGGRDGKCYSDSQMEGCRAPASGVGRGRSINLTGNWQPGSDCR
jgi:hypothetical protein